MNGIRHSCDSKKFCYEFKYLDNKISIVITNDDEIAKEKLEKGYIASISPNMEIFCEFNELNNYYFVLSKSES